MSNLWDIIVDNSTLLVQPGNTLWDHLNNQRSGTGEPYPVPVIMLEIDNNTISNYADVGLIDNEAGVSLINVDTARTTDIKNIGENI